MDYTTIVGTVDLSAALTAIGGVVAAVFLARAGLKGIEVVRAGLSKA